MRRVKRKAVWALLAVFGVMLSVCSAESVELKLYIWEEYIGDEVLADFTKETGIEVKLVYYDSDKTRDEALASGSGRQFDVVVLDNVAAQIFGKNNFLVAINEGDIANSRFVDKRWQESCGNFGIPYFYGTVGLVYDSTRYDSPPDSWGNLLQPGPKHQGRVVMVEDLVDTLIPPLMFLGYNSHTEDESELKKAYDLLAAQVGSVLNYRYVLSNIKDEEFSGRMDIAMAYSGDQYVMNEELGTENWQYVIPKEGTTVWVDCLGVTSWSQYRREAMQLIDYLTDPHQAARNTEEIYNSTPILEARQYMSKDSAEDPELFLSQELLDSFQPYRILSDQNLRLRGRIIDSLIKRHETQ